MTATEIVVNLGRDLYTFLCNVGYCSVACTTVKMITAASRGDNGRCEYHHPTERAIFVGIQDKLEVVGYFHKPTDIVKFVCFQCCLQNGAL